MQPSAKVVELLDEFDQFETESVLAEMAATIGGAFESLPPLSPKTLETVFIEFGGQRVDVGAVVEKTGARVSNDKDEYDFLGA